MSTEAYDLADNPSRAIEARLSRREFGRVSLLCMLTGSTVFGRGMPADTDYIAIGTEKNVVDLIADGWVVAGSLRVNEDGEVIRGHVFKDDFESLKRDGENIILTNSATFLDNWVAAHDECCERRPYTKAERVAIFRKHLYGEQPE